MLQTGGFDERFDHSDIDDDEQPYDDEEEEDDNRIRGYDRLNPNICEKCEKGELKPQKYRRNDPKNNVLQCENCGSYFCIICGSFIHGPTKPSRKTDIMCEKNKHKIYS